MTDNPGFSRRAWRSMIIAIAILVPLEMLAGYWVWQLVKEAIQ